MSEQTPWLRFPPVMVELRPWEYDHAANVGTRRFTANWGRKDAHHYDRQRMEDDRTAQVAAAICELAVAKFTNRYWHAHIWHPSEHNKYKDLPDVGRNIEVRRIRTGTTAAVRASQLGLGLVLWVARPTEPEFMTVEMGGWLEYDEAWDLGTRSPYSDSTRLIEVDKLKL